MPLSLPAVGRGVPASRPPSENSRPQSRRKMVYCAQSRKVPLNNKPVAMADPEAQNQIVVYQPNETVRLDVRLENETVWLTQLKIAELFGVQKAAISKHVKNIFASGELVRDATVSKLETVQTEGGRTVVRTQEFFNLDVIIAVGYRVNSRRATQFRIWATKVLKEYLLRGYSVNARLNQLEDAMHRNLAKHDDRLATLEQKVDFFVQTKEPPLQSIFYQNKFWDAKSLLIKFIRRAKKELIVIDAYPGVATLDMLAKRGIGEREAA